MPFLAACPFCRRKIQAPDTALGQSVACKKCHNYFTLAPDDDLPPAEATARTAHEYLLAAKANATAPTAPQAAPGTKSSATQTPAKPGGAQVETVQHVAMVTMPETPRLSRTMLPREDEAASSDDFNLLFLAPGLFGAVALLCAIMGWLPWLLLPLAGVGVLAGIIAWLTTPIESHRDGVLVFLGSALSAAAFVWAIL